MLQRLKLQRLKLKSLKLQSLKLQSLKDATKKRWFWRGITILVLVLIVLLGTVTARLFVWPVTGMPAKVDAIVVLGGPGDRVDYAMQLAREDRAPYLVFSRGLAGCRRDLRGARSDPPRCSAFSPTRIHPGGVGSLRRAREADSWRSSLGHITDTAWRAKLWFNRCYPWASTTASGRSYP